MSYVPELGQLMFGNKYENRETPDYVTHGVDALDSLLAYRIATSEYRKVRGEDSYRATLNAGNRHEYETAPFAIRAYSWSDCPEDDGCTEAAPCDACRPNFEHFESGFKAYWYKHSHRGETCNFAPTREQWIKIQRECEDWVLAQEEGAFFE